MGVAESIRELAASVPQRKRHVRSEEATKNAFVMPFITALGYDIHDPTEVVPEFTADAGVKQSEKVDYAIMKDGRPSILVECKSAGVSLGKEHLSQLIRYYAVTDARFGILTNGIEYQFFTDLRKPNVMDESPFMVVDMRELDDGALAEVSRFAKHTFDEQSIWDLVHTREVEQKDLQIITGNITREFATPSKEMVKLLAKGVLGKGYQSRSEWERVTRLTKRALDLHMSKTDPDKDASSQTVTVPVPTRPDDEPDYSKYQNWEQLKANPELYSLFVALREYARSLSNEVLVNPTKYYISFRRKRTVAYVKAQTGKKRLIVYVYAILERTPLRKGFTSELPEWSHYPPCNLEIIISNQDDLERAKPLLKRSYDESG